MLDSTNTLSTPQPNFENETHQPPSLGIKEVIPLPIKIHTSSKEQPLTNQNSISSSSSSSSSSFDSSVLHFD